MVKIQHPSVAFDFSAQRIPTRKATVVRDAVLGKTNLVFMKQVPIPILLALEVQQALLVDRDHRFEQILERRTAPVIHRPR